MKRILQVLCAFAFLFALAFPVQQASASLYFDDAQNYLIWDSGSRHGSAVDLSSAVVVQDTSKYIVVAALNYLVTYARPQEGVERAITPNGTAYFREHKNGSGVYFMNDPTSGHYPNGRWSKMMFHTEENAYYLIKARAIQNTK